MTRTVTASMVTAFGATGGEGAWLVSLAFSGGTEYLTTAPHPIVWGGNTYAAIGGHLEFDPIQETGKLAAQGVGITLDGVDQTTIAALLGQNYIGRDAYIYRVKFSTAGAIIGDPLLVFHGVFNGNWEITESRAENTVRVRTRLMSQLARLAQRRGVRTSVASHSAHYSGDTFFRHMTAAHTTTIWGRLGFGSGEEYQTWYEDTIGERGFNERDGRI